MNILKGFFVLEGLDGAGTTTQAKALEQLHNEKNIPFWRTYEPTSQPIGRLIRDVLNREFSVTPMTLAKLYSTDRYEHIFGEDGIIEKVNNGTIVLSDRYLFSSLAYQSIDSPFEKIFELNNEYPLPEICFFIDVDHNTSMSRLSNRKSKDIFEKHSFQEKVYAMYNKAFEQFADTDMQVFRINGNLNISEITEIIWKEIEKCR